MKVKKSRWYRYSGSIIDLNCIAHVLVGSNDNKSDKKKYPFKTSILYNDRVIYSFFRTLEERDSEVTKLYAALTTDIIGDNDANTKTTV